MKAALLARLVGCGLVVVTIACGRSPAAPREIGSPNAPQGQTTFTILDGWSRAPVAGATVTANGQL